MKRIRMLLVMMILVTLSLPACGGAYGVLTSAGLKALIDRNELGLVLVDSRLMVQFDEAHIKGAINIPLAEMEQNPELPMVQKDARLVFYCSGNT